MGKEETGQVREKVSSQKKRGGKGGSLYLYVIELPRRKGGRFAPIRVKGRDERVWGEKKVGKEDDYLDI